MQVVSILCFCLMCYFKLFAQEHLKEKTVIRVGHFATITHAQAVIGHGLSREQRGWFESFLGPDVEIQWYVYQAGSSAMEALFADSLDLTYVGPSPTINAYLKAKGKTIRVVCGSCSGGASLIIQSDRIKKISDFQGKIIATPQLGNTQDVAARAWLYSNGFEFNLFGGQVTVIPMENVDQFTLFHQGDLDAAWAVEPWASRLVEEAKGEVFLEESSLWKQTGGKYVTTHLVSTENFLQNRPDLVKKWILAHIKLTEWIQENNEQAKVFFNQELKKEVFRNLAKEIIDRAWEKIELTYAPIQASLYRYANWAYEIGFFKQQPQLKGLYDLRLLAEVLEEIDHSKGLIHDRS
ncbi:ABC transporter substrate-binding protein [Candidatus Protochlamydia sp. W-9]|uniref:ABC transporter substrate-binding protein n=1 Tax=Candidatus Protochlamydia sp. W-9 TaxID=1785087 RepID=UPI00096A9613|nr:ABC transporter substrate-binding protein [Candidatus Protochlamydia sp. W-9]